MSLGFWQLIVIIFVILLIFGAGRVPKIMEDLAKGLKSFKKNLKDEDLDDNKDKDENNKNNK